MAVGRDGGGAGVVPDVWLSGCEQGTTDGEGPGSPGWWPPGGGRLAEADLALSGNGVRGQDMDGAARGHRRSAVADGAGPAGSVPAGRAEPLSCRGGLGPRCGLGHGDGGRGRLRHAARRRPGQDLDRAAARSGRGQVPEGGSEAPHPVRHRVRGPGPGPAPRRGAGSDGGRRARMAHGPAGGLAAGGDHGGDRSAPGVRQRGSRSASGTPPWSWIRFMR